MAPLTNVAAALTLAGSAMAGRTEFPDFQGYVQEFGLDFASSELGSRTAVYEKLVEKMKAFNSDSQNTWEMNINKFTVLSDEEMQQYFGLMKMTGEGKPQGLGAPPAVHKTLPDSFDWRESHPNVVTAVKNQGACGSCWAFASTAVLESAVALATGTLFDLAPQQLTSCVENPKECGGAGGCNGAIAQLAFDYVKNNGMTVEWVWPYTSGIEKSNGECFGLSGRKAPRATISGYFQVERNDAQALMEAVNVNPVSVSVAASTWGMYGKGIFTGCDVDAVVNHAVVLMGYGVEAGNAYWLIRNSWGPTWGEYGYIRLKRSPEGETCGWDTDVLDGFACKANPPDKIKVCGMCGVLSDSAYPTGARLGHPMSPEDPALNTTKLFAMGAAASDKVVLNQPAASTGPSTTTITSVGAAFAFVSFAFIALLRKQRGQYSGLAVENQLDQGLA